MALTDSLPVDAADRLFDRVVNLPRYKFETDIDDLTSDGEPFGPAERVRATTNARASLVDFLQAVAVLVAEANELGLIDYQLVRQSDDTKQ